jgi:hypothetical protein
MVELYRLHTTILSKHGKDFHFIFQQHFQILCPFKTYFNIILPSKTRYLELFQFSDFPAEILCISYRPVRVTCPAHLIFLDSTILKILGE